MHKTLKIIGIIYTCLLITSCDFQEIEPFEMPSWNWPLSFPLLEEKYTFSGMGVTYDSTLGQYINAEGDTAVNNNIYFNPEDSTIFIEFSANLMGDDGQAAGVDESFSQYFEIESMDLGDLESVEIDPIEFPPVSEPTSVGMELTSFPDPFEAFNDPYNFFPDFYTNEFVPLTENFTVPIPLDDLPLFESVDHITIDDGLISVTVSNTFPFNISYIELTFETGGVVIFSPEFVDIEPDSSLTKSLPMTSESTQDFGESVQINYTMDIDPQIGDTTCVEFNDPAGDGVPNVDDVATCGILNTGWGLESDLSGYEFLMDITFEINNVYSITGMTVEEEMSEQTNIELPENDLVNVVGGKITDTTSVGSINSLALNLTNNLFAPITFSMEFPNFHDADGNTLSVDTDLPIGDQYIDNLSFGGKYLGNPDNPGNTIESLEVNTQITIEPYLATILLASPGGFDINQISVSTIELEYVTAVVDTLDFETPSMEIADIPSGFAGFEFANLSLEFNIFNQIGIPVQLDLELTGFKETGESVTIVIDPELSYNNVDQDNDLVIDEGASIQDTAWTKVILDKFGQTTEKYQRNKSNWTWELVSSYFEEKAATILDVMTIAPDGMLVNGGAFINGNGILAPETYVWGDFTMIAPLSFLFTEDISFIPADPTVLDSMDASTRSKIDSALVIAEMTMDITNSIPFGGDISLLVSNFNSDLCTDPNICRTHYFPVYYDQIEQIELSAQSVDSSYMAIFTSDSIFLADTIGVESVLVENISDNDNRNFLLNFLDNEGDTIFWIGRLFNLNIEPPDTVESETGYVQIPSNYLDVIELDTTRIDWVTADIPLKMMPLITFDNTDDYYCEDGSDATMCSEDGEIGICLDGTECIREPRAFQTNNYIEINSFITFTLNTGALFGGNSEDQKKENKVNRRIIP